MSHPTSADVEEEQKCAASADAQLIEFLVVSVHSTHTEKMKKYDKTP